MRYYFHVRLRDRLLPDEEGCHFVDETAARLAALRIARELSSEIPTEPHASGISAVEVSDYSNTPLFAVSVPPDLTAPL